MQRTGTMSTKHELLQQIRDAVNPAQTLQNRVAILQASLSIAGILVLVVFVSLIYGTLENTKHTTEKLDESMATTLALMQDMSSSLNTTQRGRGMCSQGTCSPGTSSPRMCSAGTCSQGTFSQGLPAQGCAAQGRAAKGQ